MSFQTLPGFREFYPESCFERNYVFKQWRKSAEEFNFEEFDGPVLEPLELFTAKSGQEIAGQLFHFTDKGGRNIALRPEMTPSLARMVGAKAGSIKRPVKWFTMGEQFRYERQQKGRLRSFYQYNADILGELSVSADAEAIHLLIHTLKSFGLTHEHFCIRLSDRDLWVYYLEACGLTEEKAYDALGVIDKLEKESSEKIIAMLEPLLQEKAASFYEKVMHLSQLTTIEAISQYFDSLGLAGTCKEKIDGRLAIWKELLALLTAKGVVQFIKIDLSIVRGLAYYTGFVFEAFQLVGQGRALAGGGRYNQLIEKLMGADFPAVGFAIGDVTLTDLLKDLHLMPKYKASPDIYVVIAEDKELALRDITSLREAGHRVEYSLKEMARDKQFKLATQYEASFALLYGYGEPGFVNVKNLLTREESIISQADLLDFVRKATQN